MAMADGRKVNPDCPNAGNPYHECMEECYTKIANGKPRKGSSKNLGYKSSGYETPKRDPQAQERRVNRACSNASNPYHECGDHCSQKKTPPEARRSMNKKETGAQQTLSRNSNMEPSPQTRPSAGVNNIKASVAPKTSSLTPSNAPSIVSEIEEVEPPKKATSLIDSGEVCGAEYSFNKAQVDSSYPSPASGNVAPMLGLSPDRRTLRDHLKESFANTTMSADSPRDLILEKTITTNGKTPPHENSIHRSTRPSISDTDTSSEEDNVQSVASEARVPVGKYQVKSSVSSILRAILDKHGDIAENCVLESVAMRSYYLETICIVVQELQSASFMNLSKSKVREMGAIVKDLEAAQMDVGWFRKILDQVSEVAEFVSQHRTVKAAKEKCDQGLESTRRKMEFQMEELVKKEKEVSELKRKVGETRQRLKEVEAEAAQLDETVAAINARIDKFQFKVLLQELL